jgi:hypothetical protein
MSQGTTIRFADNYIFNVIFYISKRLKLVTFTCSNPMISLSGTGLTITIKILLKLSPFARTGLCKVIVQMITGG